MQHIKNLQDYIPEDGLSNARYCRAENGNDWYELQAEFQEDTLKILYGEDGKIISVSTDVSTLVPFSNESVLELEFSAELSNLTINDSTNLHNYVIIGDSVELQPSKYHTFKDGEWILTDEAKLAQESETKDLRLKDLNQHKENLLKEGFNFMGAIQSCCPAEISKLNLLVEDLKDFETKNPDKISTRTVFWNFSNGKSRALLLFEVEMLRQQVVAWVNALEKTQATLLSSTEDVDYAKFKSESQKLWMELVE